MCCDHEVIQPVEYRIIVTGVIAIARNVRLKIGKRVDVGSLTNVR